MKNKLLIIISICVAIFTVGCEKKEDLSQNSLEKILKNNKIVFGVKFDTKPFGFMNEKQKLEGYDIDLARYITKSILGDENKAEFKQVTPSSRILALNSGQVDMVIATMSVTPQRSEIVDFSVPYYIAGQAIMTLKESNINSSSDLNGKRVIIIFGSTAEKNLRIMAPDANIIGFKTYTSGYSALKQDRADAMASDDTILMGFVENDKSLKLLPKRYTKEPYAIAFKKGIETQSLQERVNFVLKEMKSSGELAKLKHKWIKY